MTRGGDKTTCTDAHMLVVRFFLASLFYWYRADTTEVIDIFSYREGIPTLRRLSPSSKLMPPRQETSDNSMPADTY